MKIGNATNPFHVARAYAPSEAAAVAPVTPIDRGPEKVRSSANDERANDPLAGVRKLVAGTVPGGIDFTEDGNAVSTQADALAMYRRPGDKNAAATGVASGRVIDVSG